MVERRTTWCSRLKILEMLKCLVSIVIHFFLLVIPIIIVIVTILVTAVIIIVLFIVFIRSFIHSFIFLFIIFFAFLFVVVIDGKKRGEVQSPTLCRAFSSVYLGYEKFLSFLRFPFRLTFVFSLFNDVCHFYNMKEIWNLIILSPVITFFTHFFFTFSTVPIL